MAGFALMRKTWRCVHDQLGWPTMDIDTFDELVNSTGTGFILPVSDLTQYIRCVVDEYFELARSFRLHDGAPPSLAVAIAERKQGYDLKAVRSSILKGQRPQHAAVRDAGDEDEAPRRQKKKRVRPRDRKPAKTATPDSSATSSSDDAEPAPSPKPAKGGGGSSKAPISAFPQCKAIGAAERDKAMKEIRSKYRKHCSSFLLGKCTRDKCLYTHAVPSGFKAAARTLGYKQLGAAAKGVTFE